MPHPTRKAQIEAMALMLDSDRWDDLTLNELATKVVDDYHDLLTKGVKAAIPPPHVGMAFKTPFATKVYHVAWSDGVRAWCVSSDSNHGWWVREDDPYWGFAEESKAKAGAPGNNKDWKVGDKVSRNQRMYAYTVIATGDKCVLLEISTGAYVQADSNDNMKKYYRREG